MLCQKNGERLNQIDCEIGSKGSFPPIATEILIDNANYHGSVSQEHPLVLTEALVIKINYPRTIHYNLISLSK